MPRGKAIPEMMHWTIVRLATGTTMTPEDISMYTDVGISTVKKILACFRRTGNVNISKPVKHQPCQLLSDQNAGVCSSHFPNSILVAQLMIMVIQHLFRMLDNTPDLYLDELCLDLQQTCGISVLILTIWRTLVKGGYSMKKVCQ